MDERIGEVVEAEGEEKKDGVILEEVVERGGHRLDRFERRDGG